MPLPFTILRLLRNTPTNDATTFLPFYYTYMSTTLSLFVCVCVIHHT
jgi:hypothetical protein